MSKRAWRKILIPAGEPHGETRRRTHRYVRVDVTRCPICKRAVEGPIHKHLHVAHNWANPGSVFGRIVYGINGSMCCDGCGFKAGTRPVLLNGTPNGMREYNPQCWVCGLTFTNAEI